MTGRPGMLLLAVTVLAAAAIAAPSIALPRAPEALALSGSGEQAQEPAASTQPASADGQTAYAAASTQPELASAEGRAEGTGGKVGGVIGTRGDWSLEGRTVALLREGEGLVAEATVDADNAFAFKAVPAGTGYSVQVASVDYGPVGPCSDPEPFSVAAGETTRVLIFCWR